MSDLYTLDLCRQWRFYAHQQPYLERHAEECARLKAEIIARLSGQDDPTIDLADGTTVAVSPEGGLWWLQPVGASEEWSNRRWASRRAEMIDQCRAAHADRIAGAKGGAA